MSPEQRSIDKDWYIIEGAKFAFDPTTSLFVLESGDERAATEDFDTPQSRVLINHGKEKTSGLILNTLGLVIAPDLRKKIIKLSEDPEKLRYLKVKTSLVMREVLRKHTPIYDEMEQVIYKDTGYTEPTGVDFMSYRVQVNPKSGLFYLNTLGNCACLGPDVHAMGAGGPPISSWKDRIDLPATLGRHNNDTEAQKLSLLAGAGTIAWIAEGRQGNQMELGIA